MAVMHASPLGIIAEYDQSFRVDVCLNMPLWGFSENNLTDITIDIASLCQQLDILCKKELQSSQSIANGRTSEQFNIFAKSIKAKLERKYELLPETSLSLEAFLEVKGIATLYPRAYAYVVRPADFYIVLKKTKADNHSTQLSVLNQIDALARQIHTDVYNGNNVRYLAHQLAVLHQSLQSLTNSTMFEQIKKSIEANFGEIKACLDEGDIDADLSEELEQWLLDVTKDISTLVQTLPPHLTRDLHLVFDSVGQW